MSQRFDNLGKRCRFHDGFSHGSETAWFGLLDRSARHCGRRHEASAIFAERRPAHSRFCWELQQILGTTYWRGWSEWLVRLRFPGDEDTKTINGVPEGWEGRTVGDV